MSISASSSLSLGSSHYNFSHAECSTSYGISCMGMRPFDGRRMLDITGMRCRNLFLGSAQFNWLQVGNDVCLSRVSVAADYSDSVPDSSNYISDHGYHPLEEVKVYKRVRDTKLTSAEIARTTVEAGNSALLVFPGTIHCEPHEQISWAELQYVVDDYGDMFFEISDEENILEDPGANNPVNVFIGMDIPIYEAQNMDEEDSNDILDISSYDAFLEADYVEVMDIEDSANPDWSASDPSSSIHPIYFAKCMSKAISKEYDKRMDNPTNGVSVWGCLRPAFPDEESYLRRLLHNEDDDYNLNSKDASMRERDGTSSILYRLEIMKIDLFSVYGVQSQISLQDFSEAEPDYLVHTTSAILKRFSEKGIRCNAALKALCKKKGLHVEAANLIGVDSLGLDVRVHSGVEVQTHRFPFKIQATSEAAAEKQIRQLLFPRSRRKKLRTQDLLSAYFSVWWRAGNTLHRVTGTDILCVFQQLKFPWVNGAHDHETKVTSKIL